MSITAPRRSGENAFSCTTSGQAGKNGSRPFASTRSPTWTNEAGSRSRSSSLAADEVLGVRRPSTGGRARRGSARSRGSARAPRSRERLPRRGEALRRRRGARRPCSRGCSTASRRRPRLVTSGSASRKLSTRPSFSSAIAIPAGLRSQTPISQTASKPSAAIASHSRRGHAGEADLLAHAARAARRARPRC